MAARGWIGVLVGGTAAAAAAGAGTWYGLLREPAAPPAALVTAPGQPPTQPQAAKPEAPKPNLQVASDTQTAPVAPTSGPSAKPPGQPAAGAAADPKPQAQAEPTQKPAAPAEPTPAAARPAAAIKLPTFDIVRLEPTGDAVVAGQGVPGATVELLRDGKPYARAVADVGGQWAIVPPPLAKGPAELSLRVTTPDGRVAISEQVVTVRVPEKQDEQVVVLLNDPNSPSKVLNDGAPKKSQPQQQVAQVLPARTPSPPAADPALTEPAADPAGNAAATKPAPRQPAPATAELPKPDVRANAEIRTVEADESGRFFVTGTAQPGADIRIYVNETPLANVKAAPDGSFGMTVERGMTPGNYRVRVDDIEVATGKVLTRAEVPFAMATHAARPAAPAAVVTAQADVAPNTDGVTRDIAPLRPGVSPPAAPGKPRQQQADAGKPAEVVEPTPVASPSVAVVPEIKTVAIVRGDNLWRISRKSYGRGIRYTWIYDANVKQIRDPHWIYPGQIFVMPDRKETATP